MRSFTGGLKIDQVAEGVVQFTLRNCVGNDLPIHVFERLLTLLDVRHVLGDDLSRPRHVSALRNLVCYLLVKSLPYIRRRATDQAQRLIDRRVIDGVLIELKRRIILIAHFEQFFLDRLALVGSVVLQFPRHGLHSIRQVLR